MVRLSQPLGLRRLIIILGLLVVTAAFVLDMSGSAPRIADTDHISDPVFAATVPGGATACEPVAEVPNDVASVRFLIGTYGRPVPALGFRFLDPQGRVLAIGTLPAGTHEGYVRLPIFRRADLGRANQACIHVAGTHTVVLAGEAGPGGTETVNGKGQPGNISLTYLRPGSESWWQLLPTLDTRFGLGKASWFGNWTLPVMAVLLLAVWIAAVRLLWSEQA